MMKETEKRVLLKAVTDLLSTRIEGTFEIVYLPFSGDVNIVHTLESVDGYRATSRIESQVLEKQTFIFIVSKIEGDLRFEFGKYMINKYFEKEH